MRSMVSPQSRRVAAALIITTGSWTVPVNAGCDKAELAAEAALLKHTQIMVTSLLCDAYSTRVSGEQRPYALYKAFTNRHRRALADWETLVASKIGQAQFDFWRTELANEVSRAEVQKASAMGKDVYCEGATGAVKAAMRLSDRDVLAFAALEPGEAARCATVEMSERPSADDAGLR